MSNTLNDKNKQLTKRQRFITQERGTEPPFSGRLLNNRAAGTYRCVCCDEPLFTSDTKFDSGCGWPSFFEPATPNAVSYIDDYSHNMHRTEIRCSHCDAHLGHVFPDGPPPTGQRYCLNSGAMIFIDGETGETIEG